MTSDEHALLPSRSRELLETLVGKTIHRLARFAEEQPAELIASPAYASRGIDEHQLFSMADGPGLIGVSGSEVLVGQSTDLLSLTLEPFDAYVVAEDWPFVVEASDSDYSDVVVSRLVGSRAKASKPLGGSPI